MSEVAGERLIAGFKKQRRLIAILSGAFAILIVSSLVIIYLAGLAVTKGEITQESQLAQSDITYSNGTWDTSKYDADSQIPGGNRVYLITKDGFVIDRWRPIPGYLDTSDFKQLSVFQQPTTLNTVNQQIWRIYSQPITDGHGNVLALITVGRNITTGGTISLVDQHLMQAAAEIANDVPVSGQTVNVDKVNEDDVPFLTSFQVVSQYNEILVKSDYSNTADHLPNYIDPSYIVNELSAPSLKTIKSSKSGEPFLVSTVPLKDSKGRPIGTLIIGRTLTPFTGLLKDFILPELIAALILVILAAAAAEIWDAKLGSTSKAPIKGRRLTLDKIQSIRFAESSSQIIVNDKKLPVTYASNQYYLCIALFSAPKKKWESDQLMERLDGQHNKDSQRKIYDAAVSINKKFNTVADAKLIVTNNKTYQINPTLVNKLAK